MPDAKGKFYAFDPNTMDLLIASDDIGDALSLEEACIIYYGGVGRVLADGQKPRYPRPNIGIENGGGTDD